MYLVATLFFGCCLGYAGFVFGVIAGRKKGIEMQKEAWRSEKFNIAYDVFNKFKSDLEKQSKHLGAVGEHYATWLRQNLEGTRNYAKK